MLTSAARSRIRLARCGRGADSNYRIRLDHQYSRVSHSPSAGCSTMPRVGTVKFQIEKVHLEGCRFLEVRLNEDELRALQQYLAALGVSGEVELERCPSDEEDQGHMPPVATSKLPEAPISPKPKGGFWQKGVFACLWS